MSAFWKGLIASIAVYQVVLTYWVLNLAAYFVWLRNTNQDFGWGILGTTDPTRQSAEILGGTLILLVIFNLVMLFKASQDG